MKKSKFMGNKNAVSIVQDTLLFLVFISISAMILSPAIIQINTDAVVIDKSNDLNVQEVLHTLLSSTVDQYSYRTAASYIDSVACVVGINTTQPEGLYQTITDHFLGKQQYHKPLSQLIPEQLTTQYQIKINTSTISCNPFLGNANQKLTTLIKNRLDQILPSRTHYNFTAYWQPIHEVSFGGKISVGEHIPPTTCYSAHQTLSLPILPRIKIGNQSIFFSSYHIKSMINSSTFVLPQIQNISNLQNSSMQLSNSNRSLYLTQNISSLLYDILITGCQDNTSNLILPSALDIILSYIFNADSFSMKTNDLQQSSENYLDPLNSIFNMCQQPSQQEIPTDLTASIFSSFGSSITSLVQPMLLNTLSDFIDLVKSYIIDLIHPIITLISSQIVPLFLSTQKPVLSLIEDLIDTMFSHLSLSTAQVSLTVWRG